MTQNPFNWCSGTRGPYPGRWLIYRREDFSRFIQTPDSENVQFTTGPRGDIHPWDWCRDILYFDPSQPWLAFIPTSNPAKYENSARRQSWLFPSSSHVQSNFRSSSRGGYTASLDIIEHATAWLPRIKRLADVLAESHQWSHALPAIPDARMLAQRLETPDQVLAHLWSFRRPALSLLGFIHCSLSNWSIRTGVPAQNCPALQEPDLLDFVRDHLFSGQDFRGVLVDVEQFGHYYQRDSGSCEPILQLLTSRPNSPIPLVIHHPPPCDVITVPRLHAVFTSRTLKLRLGKQSAYMMKNRASRSGFRILNKKITARARAHHKSMTLQSELDGVNLVLFFFEELLQANQYSHSTHLEESDDEDCPDLPELEPEDFCGFQPGKLQHLPDAIFLFDTGKLPEPIATSSRPQQPVPDVTHGDANPHMLYSGNEKPPPFELKLNV